MVTTATYETTDATVDSQLNTLQASGANVLLVERPRSGSAVRWEPPFLDDLPGVERGGLFMYTASGKRSLTLDPISPDGAAILRRLLERADVLIDDRELSAGSAPAETASALNSAVSWGSTGCPIPTPTSIARSPPFGRSNNVRAPTTHSITAHSTMAGSVTSPSSPVGSRTLRAGTTVEMACLYTI